MGTSQRDDSPPRPVVQWIELELGEREHKLRRRPSPQKTEGIGSGTKGRRKPKHQEGQDSPVTPLDLPTIILHDLGQNGVLVEKLGEPFALKCLEELSRFAVQVQRSGSLAQTMLDRYGVERLDEMPALQIVQAVGGALGRHGSGGTGRSLIKAASKTLDWILGEPASLPIASSEDIQDHIRQPGITPRFILAKFYAAYLFQMVDYHYSQVAPRFAGPTRSMSKREQGRQAPSGDDAICESKAETLADILDRACVKYEKRRLADLQVLDPSLMGNLFAKTSDEIQGQLASPSA